MDKCIIDAKNKNKNKNNGYILTGDHPVIIHAEFDSQVIS